MKIKELIPLYLKHLKTIGRADKTISNAKYDLNTCMKFLELEKVHNLEDLTSYVLEDYQQDLAFRITQKGSPLSIRTQSQFLSSVKCFTRYLKTKDYMFQDPCEKIILPKKPKRLPSVILSSKEIKQIMETPDIQTNNGYRNRIILEILYDTGIRRSEVKNIKLTDIDHESGYIHIHGKGNKDRVVPVSERVCQLITNYTLFIRPEFLKKETNDYLILNRWGKQMTPGAVYEAVRASLKSSGIRKKISTHTFRHTCATHMLKKGAPVRHLQEMLGHESLESTQIYTRVTINDLKKIHAKYHPGDDLR